MYQFELIQNIAGRSGSCLAFWTSQGDRTYRDVLRDFHGHASASMFFGGASVDLSFSLCRSFGRPTVRYSLLNTSMARNMERKKGTGFPSECPRTCLPAKNISGSCETNFTADASKKLFKITHSKNSGPKKAVRLTKGDDQRLLRILKKRYP
jgi:hypothetical protein